MAKDKHKAGSAWSRCLQVSATITTQTKHTGAAAKLAGKELVSILRDTNETTNKSTRKYN